MNPEDFGHNFHSLPEEAQQRVRENILAIDLLLSTLVERVTGHLEHSKNNCIKCCLGFSAGILLEELAEDENVIQMLLMLALRELAQHEYEKSAVK